MKKTVKTFLFALALLAASIHLAMAAEAERFPIPDTVSSQVKELMASPPPPYWKERPKNTQEWKALVKAFVDFVLPVLPALREQVGVTVVKSEMAGVPVFILTPKDMPKEHDKRVLLNFHGGGYVLGPGESGTPEAILMAGIGKYRVIMPDYRMAPDHPYPAAMDDAASVYKELLKSFPAENIGVFGTSTGGGMTLALMLRAKAEGLPLPAAIAAGTPWSDLTKAGDSYFTNAYVDNVLVTYDNWLSEAAKVYAAGHDMKDPMLSPVYGDVRAFPPALLTSGTRDLFLSNTVRMHLKLREAGVEADLIVFEGLSHAQYHMRADAPETRFHFTELATFFGRHLK